VKWLGISMLIFACSSTKLEAAEKDEHVVAKLRTAPIRPDALCVTKGAAAVGARVTVPAMRAIARGSSGEAAALRFTYRGDTEDTRALASGQLRRQLGLKLRAMNGCNLIYVMWRLDPKPKLDVSIKLNPGMKTHKECGAEGYTKVHGRDAAPVPALEVGATHVLRAEIAGDELVAWIDDRLAWRGELPAAAHDLSGPAGMRSDNLAFDLVAFEAPAGDARAALPKCVVEEGD